jgi:hypothetical protein
MTRCWPFRKFDTGASSSTTKKKPPPPKKGQNQPYMSMEIAQGLYDQNASVGLHNVHLLGGWNLIFPKGPTVAHRPHRGR